MEIAFNGFIDFFQKANTFRPRKKLRPGTMRYSLYKQAQASLNSGINLRTTVHLPEGENLDDWIAVHVVPMHVNCFEKLHYVHKNCEVFKSRVMKSLLSDVPVVDFFNRINLIYGTISETCTEKSCPTMCGGAKFEYLWADGVKYKKPTKLSAPQYINLLMDWTEEQINNENIFPISSDVPFPKGFIKKCSKILTRLFRVFVHVYIHHFDRIIAIRAEPHVNTCYKHFYYFVSEFKLVAEKELEPLKEMTARVCHDKSPSPKK